MLEKAFPADGGEPQECLPKAEGLRLLAGGGTDAAGGTEAPAQAELPAGAVAVAEACRYRQNTIESTFKVPLKYR